MTDCLALAPTPSLRPAVRALHRSLTCAAPVLSVVHGAAATLFALGSLSSGACDSASLVAMAAVNAALALGLHRASRR